MESTLCWVKVKVFCQDRSLFNGRPYRSYGVMVDFYLFYILMYNLAQYYELLLAISLYYDILITYGFSYGVRVKV